MRSFLGILAAIFLACFPLASNAMDLTGTFEGRGITIKIAKIDSVWKVRCKEQDSNSEYDYAYLDEIPYEGSFERWSQKFECAPSERVAGDNYYKVSISSRKKLDCRTLGDVIGEYDPGQDTLDTHNKDYDNLWMGLKDSSTLGVDMPNATRRVGECSELYGYYKRRK